ncbi:MAG: ABC transporter substrate-binding protein [Acetivibrionales bacterium]
MKRLISIILVLVLTLSLVACGKTEGPGTTGTPTTTPSPGNNTAAPKANDMTMWIFLNPESAEDPRNIVLKEIVEEYNRTNEAGNKVTVESIHWSKIESQAIQAAAAGTGPDIINIYTDMLKQHIAGGTVQPMTKLAEEFISTIPDYSYSADTLKIQNEIYTLPWESRTFVYWYRDDIFEKVPTSLDELADIGGSKSTALAMGFVIGLSEGSNAASFMESFIPFLRSAGGTLFDENGKAAFNSDAGVKSLEYIKSLVEKNAMNNTTLSLTVDDIIDAFKAGTILSVNAGTQRAAAIRQSQYNDNIKSSPILGFTAGTPSPALVAGQSLGIGKYAKNPEASFDFIKTFFTEENQVKWLKANVLPVRASVYDNAEIKALSNYEELKSWNEYASTGAVEFYPEDYSELSVRLVKAAQEVIFNNADAKAKLDEVAAWYNDKNK